MTNVIELKNLRRAIIGSSGSVRLTGADVMPRHAEIVAFEPANEPLTAVRPLDGRLAVERRGRVWEVNSPWPLADGDVILIGPHRLRYSDLGSPFQPAAEPVQTEMVSWLL